MLVTHYEIAIRIACFLGIFLILACIETLIPRRILTVSKRQRWISNISIVVLNSLILRLLFPMAAVGMALFAENHAWGIFNYYQLPLWIAILFSVVMLDLVIYLQHVMFHAIPWLWRIHRMHHADLDIDVTTGSRFHPIEIILSMLIKFAAICLLGAPVLSVMIFEILLNATSMFNHSNIFLPLGFDRVLRWTTVTPDMHRIHHSTTVSETNSNFGFNFPWWDYIFGTYQDQPTAGHQQMNIGIDTFRDVRHCSKLWGMLSIPFIKSVIKPS